jgi:hypothetical protein
MALQDYITPREEEYPLSEETAKAEVRRLIDFYEIELDPNVGEGAVKATEKLLDTLAKYYRLGLLENKPDDKGFTVAQRLKNGTILTYRELAGDDVTVAQRIPPQETLARSYALMGRLCGYGADALKKLKGRDKDAMLGLSEIFFWA